MQYFEFIVLLKEKREKISAEIYFGGDKCRNFDHFAHLVPKIISAENYLRRIFISAEYLSPPNIYLRRIYISAEYLSPPNFFSRFSFSSTINSKYCIHPLYCKLLSLLFKLINANRMHLHHFLLISD